MAESTEVRTDGNSLLKAVYLSRLRLTRLLLEGGAYINESNEHGETPLMVACKTHHTDSQSVPKLKMIRYLLENGADPNIQDKTGKTALMHACLEQAGAEILSLLLSSGAAPTLEDHAGFSALVYAINSGNREVLRVLLDACKAKGKEVIIITTNKLPSGHHLSKQYLNVPPPPDLEECLHYTPTSCCMSPYEVQLRIAPQASSASASPQPGSPHLECLGSGPGIVTSRASSPIQHSSPLLIPGVDKQLNLQRLHSEQWSKSPSLLLQQSQASSLTEEPMEITPEEELSFRVNNSAFQRRPPAVSRHHSIDVKNTTGLLKALENMLGNENRWGGGKRCFGRKMSYDSAASSPHSASHPNLHQVSLPFPSEPSPVDGDSSDCLRQLQVSSLQNVVCRRNIGIDHYNSDSQLPQFNIRDNSSKNGGGAAAGPEKHKLVNSRSSTLSGSRESLESSVQRRGAAGLERRGSGALLLDHIAHTRPGYLPPLNPHAPIPDIGVSSSFSYPLSGNSKTLNGTGSKPIPPCAAVFQRDLKPKKMLWRRHSMQSEQINQLVNFKETFGN
ncbi:ankyrin repeat domain-containing protein 34B-like [Micropterus salmoides]|uniref:ankyrin repeat domain-containing protein 34B-like n=1 Tax=Micropterus salmoides TaxID=27706 RepID=UPI0018ECACBB|nr:ankyrin repeat domain-containing protein 34B-like [Micropterus salmoides]XP_038581897.1 ankyrin repeat domain-containing protein 34B-like [Micropterus salmoides]